MTMFWNCTTVYMPPSRQWKLEEQICQDFADNCKNNRIVIGGDFNFTNIDWDCHGANGLHGWNLSSVPRKGSSGNI